MSLYRRDAKITSSLQTAEENLQYTTSPMKEIRVFSNAQSLELLEAAEFQRAIKKIGDAEMPYQLNTIKFVLSCIYKPIMLSSGYLGTCGGSKTSLL